MGALRGRRPRATINSAYVVIYFPNQSRSCAVGSFNFAVRGVCTSTLLSCPQTNARWSGFSSSTALYTMPSSLKLEAGAHRNSADGDLMP